MDLTRRDLLAVGALLPLAACTTPDAPPLRAVDPDVALRAAAVTREQALLSLYDEAVAALPDQALWTQLRADHATHLTRLLEDPADPSDSPSDSPSASASPGASATGTTAPAARPVPVLRRELLVLTRSTAREHAAAVPAASRDLAAVLASLAACESSHAAVL